MGSVGEEKGTMYVEGVVGQVALEILRMGVELRFRWLFLIENFSFLDIP